MSAWRDEEEQRGKPQTGDERRLRVRVAAIVPLPTELGGVGEVLAIAAFGSARLPAGDLNPGESLFAAARRVIWQAAGVGATAERLVYLVERAGRELVFCVLCALDGSDDAPERAGVRFVSPATADEFEPEGTRELLLEDCAQGFARPVAHIVLTATEQGREAVTVHW
jgi:ADP-ribose pyrophosphatase YjhB (NUDIX family)